MGADRAQLAAFVAKSVSGPAAPPVALTGAAFLDIPVDFGEISTDEAGRLVVLPGNGQAYSISGATLSDFSDNDGYCDTICDGAVVATVRVDGRELQAAPAWYVSTPPNFGPAIAAGLIIPNEETCKSCHEKAPHAGPLGLGGLRGHREDVPEDRQQREEQARPEGACVG